MEEYRPRSVRFHGVRAVRGMKLKLYSISWNGAEPDWEMVEPGLTLAFSKLPAEGVVPGRPGLGFAIAHHGRTTDYVVLSWWDNENELPTPVFVRSEGRIWREGAGSESFCVWDLEVIWFERDAYVRTLLSGNPGDQSTRYLTLHSGANAVRA
jgi:hypothetical protein